MTAFETASLIIAGANATATAIRLEAAASGPARPDGRSRPCRRRVIVSFSADRALQQPRRPGLEAAAPSIPLRYRESVCRYRNGLATPAFTARRSARSCASASSSSTSPQLWQRPAARQRIYAESREAPSRMLRRSRSCTCTIRVAGRAGASSLAGSPTGNPNRRYSASAQVAASSSSRSALIPHYLRKLPHETVRRAPQRRQLPASPSALPSFPTPHPLWGYVGICGHVRKGTGGARGSRTPDLLNAIQALSRLSYGPPGTGRDGRPRAEP